MKVKLEPSGRFHMPGHKGRKAYSDLYDLDITEIPGADNLHDAKGIIKELERKLASIYKSQVTAVLVNGSTAGLQCAMLATCQPGEELLVSLNCHRSVFGALALGRIKPRFITPILDDELGFAREISPEAVAAGLKAYPSVKGLVVVSPTYYGTVCELNKIAEILHQQGKILIVDEAHGAQFTFAKGYPQTALEAGADLVIQSTHKVLGSLTQSALIHGQGKLMNWDRVQMFLSVLQSSSPSYPLMISVEEATDSAHAKGAAVFEMIRKKHRELIKNQPDDAMIRLYDSGDALYDYSKWLFSTGKANGCELEKILRDEFAIQCEMTDEQSILLMTGLETTSSDIDKMTAAIASLNRVLGKSDGPKSYQVMKINEPILEKPLWEALWTDKKEKTVFKKSVGQIAADFIIPYPPGIPILIPGCRITEAIIEEIQRLLDAGVGVVGIDSEEKFLVIKEEL
ncbi:aminotransferase class I/II-fold pyridoxal phosphate-dependent enzyme [Eubacteriaceae bacterium ES3]|nr:aminotransferase class I/II-fold pyridoxal phosphate-dependent enzyme [Eubacteriaceae bacterium ES3]